MLLQKERLLNKWKYFGRKQYNFHVMYTFFCQSATFILPSLAFYAYQLAKCQIKAVGPWLCTPGYSDVYDMTLVISFHSFSTT